MRLELSFFFWAFRLIFRIFRNPKIKDGLLEWYSSYIEKRGFSIITFADLGNINHANISFDDDVVKINQCVVFENGIIRIGPKSFVIKDVRNKYPLLLNLRKYSGDSYGDQADKVVFFGSPYNDAFQFFHFVTDAIVPNYIPEIKHPYLLKKVPSQFESEMLKTLGIDNYSYVHEKGTYCDELVSTSVLSKWNKPQYSVVREKFGIGVNSGNDYKLFISREGEARNFDNSRDIHAYFESKGFQIINFATVSLEERIDLLANTSVLAGQYGAGLTNALFMPSGGKVLDIQPGDWVKEDYQLMSLCCDLKYFSFPLPIRFMPVNSTYRFTKSDFERLEAFLQIMNN